MSNIDPGPGYRLLKVGEPRAGTEFTRDGGATWVTVNPFDLERNPLLSKDHFLHRIRIQEQLTEFRWHPASEPPCMANGRLVLTLDGTGIPMLVETLGLNKWPTGTVIWIFLPRPAESDDGFQKWWDGLQRTSPDTPDYRLFNGTLVGIVGTRAGWQAALAAQKGK